MNNKKLALAVAGLLLLPVNVKAAEPGVIPRTILAVFDSTEDYNRTADANLIRRNAEVPLNYLGLKVRYHDLAAGLPAENSMRDVLGILTWFQDDEMADAEKYARWAAAQIQAGKRYVALGLFGFARDKRSGILTSAKSMDAFLTAFGVSAGGGWTENPFIIELVKKESSMVEFERTLEHELEYYDQFTPTRKGSKSYLVLRLKNRPGSESSVVFTTPRGGFAMQSYDILLNYADNRMRWRINPFRFFNEAYGLEVTPRYDTTTRFGRRLFYSHIDGDGFENLAGTRPEKLSAEVVYDQILKAYDLPFTVSVITSTIDPRYNGSDYAAATAQKIFSLPNVEAGVHTFSHPLYWNEKIVSFKIKGYSAKPWSKKLARRGSVPDDDVSENTVQEGFSVSWNTGHYLNREIREAVDYVNGKLLPAGKRAQVYQWSGDCRPTKEALEHVEDEGLMNINGGDGRIDRLFPTYTVFSPLGRNVGGLIQVYTSSANENIFTDLWQPPYDRYAHVIQTFQQTEIPTLIDGRQRRIAPINVYYHFYAAEKETSLFALKEAYDYVLSENTLPVFTSKYIRIVRGFFSGTIRRDDDSAWIFSDYGEDHTVRLDGVSEVPDLVKSKGILGFKRWGNSLYIDLAANGPIRLYLKAGDPGRPYLEESSFDPDSVIFQGGNFTASGHIYRGLELCFRRMGAGDDYTLQVSNGSGKVLENARIRSDRDGTLDIRSKITGDVSVALKILKER